MTEANTASAAWQDAVIRSRTRETGAPEHARDDAESWQTEVWVRDDETAAAPAPGRTRAKKERTLPPDVVRELAGAGPRRSAALQKRLGEAVRAYEADRYADALRILKALVDVAPASAAVRELNGLTLYRLGRWKVALSELQAAHLLSGSVDQYPVMADCARALGRHKAVAQRWEELRKASPSGEILAEGRIVMAGSLSDQGKVSEAIALLERSGADRARPRDHHLRSWYALADLYERAGDVPHARELFKRIARFDADFHDVAERLAAL